MLRDIYEVYIPAFKNDAYLQYKTSLEQTLKSGRTVDFSAPYFTSVDGQVIMFPKYKQITDNPFLPNSELPFSYVIDAQPVVTTRHLSPKDKDKKQKDKTSKDKTSKDKTSKDKKTGDQEQPSKYKMPKAVFEALMNNLPFKNTVECKSSAKSKPFFISKPDLIDYIKKNPDLEKYFPKNYKTLSKGELCDVVFGN